MFEFFFFYSLNPRIFRTGAELFQTNYALVNTKFYPMLVETAGGRRRARHLLRLYEIFLNLK